MRKKILSREDVGYAAQAACLLEVAAPKPGNVNRYYDFEDVLLEDFLLSAVLIGKHMENAYRKTVGETVLCAVKATREIINSNTNLGIILLFAPLAKAYGKNDLRVNLKDILLSLTVEDAAKVYQAIRMAEPGGLGRVATADITEEPNITLRESMQLAKNHDTIAREYVSNFAVTFELGKPALENLIEKGCDFKTAVLQTYLKILAEIPDTLIIRKAGFDKACEVSKKAASVLRAGGLLNDAGLKAFADLDNFLRKNGNRLNPGTTADLVAATLFVFFLEHGLEVWREARTKICKNRLTLKI